jgi:hypothetical protein
MKKILSVVLFAAASFSAAYGQAGQPAASATGDAIKQLERDWGAAQKSGDVGKLSQIIADDWAGIGPDGAISTKKGFLDNVKSGTSKVQSIDFGPMDVRVIGTVAVVQGSDTEKSSFKGKDTSGKWAWMDVFVLRDGKWQAVRSQSAMVK